MLLRAPSAIVDPLYTGPLDVTVSGTRFRGSADDSLDSMERPTVSLGEPQSWNVEQTLTDENAPIPVDMKQLLTSARFAAIRLACSFSAAEGTVIERARLSVKLTNASNGLPDPIAFDLHPRSLDEVVKKTVALKVAPSLKLQPVEASAGEAGITFEYTELIPHVTAFGIQTASFSWDLKPTQQYAVHGIRLFHAVLKVEPQSNEIIMRLQLMAGVRIRGILYYFAPSTKASDLMVRTVRLEN